MFLLKLFSVIIPDILPAREYSGMERRKKGHPLLSKFIVEMRPQRSKIFPESWIMGKQIVVDIDIANNDP
jgi:hypothetical protein